MYALVNAVGLHIHWGNYEEANSFDHELMALAEETNAFGCSGRDCLRNHGMAFNGSDTLDALGLFGEGLR